MSTIPIKTYAGFWQRVNAFVLDYVIILFYLAAVTLIFFLLNSLFGPNLWLFTNRVRAQVTGFLLITLPVTLYFAIGESSNQQATWGKRRAGLKVGALNGERIGFWKAFARTLLKFIPWELSHTLIWEVSFSPETDSVLVSLGFALVYVLVGLNIASLLMTRDNQTVYDLIVGTYVIKQNP